MMSNSDQEWLKKNCFEYEVCDECGWDADQHTVIRDPFGHKYAWCDDPISENLTFDGFDQEMNRRLKISTEN